MARAGEKRSGSRRMLRGSWKAPCSFRTCSPGMNRGGVRNPQSAIRNPEVHVEPNALGDAARSVSARGGDRGKLGTGWNPSLPAVVPPRPIILLLTHEPSNAAHGKPDALGDTA